MLGSGSTKAAGVVAEWTEEQDAPQYSIVSFVSLTTWLAPGRPSRIGGHSDGHDYLRFDLVAVSQAPASYEGMSGSGLWLLGLSKDPNGTHRIADGRLVRVTYWLNN